MSRCQEVVGDDFDNSEGTEEMPYISPMPWLTQAAGLAAVFRGCKVSILDHALLLRASPGHPSRIKPCATSKFPRIVRIVCVVEVVDRIAVRSVESEIIP